jgi:ribosomal protein L2
MYDSQGVTIGEIKKEDNNNENIGKAGVAGYNGDITQYLEDKI